MGLDDALRICLLLRSTEPASHERAALRWIGRFCLECADATMDDAELAARAFARLPGDPSAIRDLEALALA